MSFLKPAGDGGTGLGQSLGLNPTDVRAFGTAMNGIASAGGASPGYAAPQASAAPPINNHMQLLDPNLQAILQHFAAQQPMRQIGGVYQ